MNLLFQHYRSFSFSLAKEKALVFKNPDKPQAAPTPAAQKSAAPAKKWTADDFKKHETTFNGHVAKLPPAIKSSHESSFKKAFKALQDQYQNLFKKPKNKELQKQAQALHQRATELLAKIKSHHAKPSVKPVLKNNNDKVGNKIDFSKVIEKVAKLVGVTTNVGKAYLKRVILPTLKFDKNRIQQINNGALELTENEIKEIRKKLPTELRSPSKVEHRILKRFTQNSKLAKYFDQFNDDAFQVLSRRYTIHFKKGALHLYQNGKKVEGSPIKKAEDLIHFFDPALKNEFKSVLKGGNGVDEKALAKKLKLRNLEYKAALKFKEVLFPGDKPSNNSMLGSLTMLLALYKRVMDAIKRNDFKELKDYLSAWNQAKNPKKLAEMVDGAKKHYLNALKKRAPQAGDFKRYLKAYISPNSEEANMLFTFTKKGNANKPELMRFRTQARGPLKQMLASRLSKVTSGSNKITNVTKISKLPNGSIELQAYRNNQRVSIQVDLNVPLKNAVKVYEYLPSKNGKTKLKSTFTTLDFTAFDGAR